MSAYYLDSNLFAALLLKQQRPEIQRECRSWLERAERAEVAGVISTLVWDEVVYTCGRLSKGPSGERAYHHKVAHEASVRLLAMSFLQIASPGVEDLHVAQDLLRDLPLRPRDALHAALALSHADGNLVTLDTDFERRELRARLGLNVIYLGDGSLQPRAILT